MKYIRLRLFIRQHGPWMAWLTMLSVLAMILILMVAFCPQAEAASCKTAACGYESGKSFLPPDSVKGVKMRYAFQRMHDLWGPWCWKYQPDDYVGCLSRIWFESRSDPNSHTKDTLLMEAGLTSVSWETAKLIEEDLGKGGQPCGDPEWSIAAGAYRKAVERQTMLEGVTPKGEPTFWASFLPDLWRSNRIEAEYFMSVAGSVNSYKVAKMLKFAEAESGVLSSKHPWWNFITWMKGKTNPQLQKILSPLKVEMWRFWFRIGRSSINGWKKRAEFFEPIDGSPNYCWGTEMFTFPSVPDPKYPITKQAEHRNRCIHYKQTVKRKKLWDIPEDLTGEAGQAWVDEQQAAGLLPSDEEYATWEASMDDSGCAFVRPVSDEDWAAWTLKAQKKWKKAKKAK